MDKINHYESPGLGDFRYDNIRGETSVGLSVEPLAALGGGVDPSFR